MLQMPNRSLTSRNSAYGRWIQKFSALATVLVGSAAFLGWVIGIPALTSVLPGHVPMAANSALSFMAFGAGALLLPPSLGSPRLAWRKSAAVVLAALPIMIGVLTLAEYAAGIAFGIDELLFIDLSGSYYPGRPALASASSLVCIGVALLLLARAASGQNGSGRRSVLAAHLFGLVPASVGYLSLAGYLFDVRSLYSFGPFNSVALNTGIVFGLTALAILHTAPEIGWRRFFAEFPAAAQAFERRLALVLSLPLLIGAISVWGARIGAYDPAFASVLLAFAAAAGSSALTWRLTASKTKLVEEALRQSEERFRGIFEHAATGIAIADMQGRFQSCNPAFSAMLGYSVEELQNLTIPKLQHPDDLIKNVMEVRRLVTGEVSWFEMASRNITKDGKPIWVHKHVSLLRDPSGKPTHIMALVTDITERKRYEEQIRLLMLEVNHRFKNMLGLVLAMARQTLAATPEQFLERFGERVEALAASQNLLATGAWKGVYLDELMRSQLAHFEDLIGTRITLSGPPLLICAPAAQAIGMALHELATNAGKYGALSVSNGQVEIAWRIGSAEGGEQTFAMHWREQGGPPVKAPSGRGFGSIVVGAMIESSLDAQVEVGFPATGFCWKLQCSAGKVLDMADTAEKVA